MSKRISSWESSSKRNRQGLCRNEIPRFWPGSFFAVYEAFVPNASLLSGMAGIDLLDEPSSGSPEFQIAPRLERSPSATSTGRAPSSSTRSISPDPSAHAPVERERVDGPYFLHEAVMRGRALCAGRAYGRRSASIPPERRTEAQSRDPPTEGRAIPPPRPRSQEATKARFLSSFDYTPKQVGSNHGLNRRLTA